MPEEFLTIPATNEENGFTGYNLSPQVKDGYKTEMPWSSVMQMLGSEGEPPPSENSALGTPKNPEGIPALRDAVPAVAEWGEEENKFQYLPDWTDDECEALGLPPVTELDSKAQSSAGNSLAEKMKTMSREDLNT
jgi:hypothetical protein